MQFAAGLIGDAAALAREHDEVLARLPATIQAFILVELKKWPTLFAPEQRYQRVLLEQLARFSSADLLQAGAAITRIENEAGCNTIARGDPARFQDQAQALLRRQRLVAAGRGEPALFAAARDHAGFGPLDAWIVESHQALDALWDEHGEPARTVTALSYDRLRGYRTDLARALYAKVVSGVESPQAFAAYA